MSAGLAVLAEAMQHTAQFSFNLSFVVNRLPLWFLVFALFLPRMAMAGGVVSGSAGAVSSERDYSAAVLAVFAEDSGAVPDLRRPGTDAVVSGSSGGGASGMGRRRSPDAAQEAIASTSLSDTADDGVVMARYS